jgi:transposase
MHLPALEPWLAEATSSGVPELRTFAAGIKRDQAAVLAALTYEWREAKGAKGRSIA